MFSHQLQRGVEVVPARRLQLLLVGLLWTATTTRAWLPRTLPHRAACNTALSAQEDVAVLQEEPPESIPGAEFFGGNRQKEEFYDPVAEAEATVLTTAQTYDRFADTDAFADEFAATVARRLQALLRVDDDAMNDHAPDIAYSPQVDWQSPLAQTTTSPLTELAQAKSFYRHVNVAITSGQSSSSSSGVMVELRWEVSVVWPTLWAPRVLLTGTSELTLMEQGDDQTNMTIQKQVDQLDHQTDWWSHVARQLVPRFWDLYHIAMTPSAELGPAIVLPSPTLFPSSYQILDLPGRLVLEPTQLDTGARIDQTASTVPMHAFSTFIKTMGPQTDRYVPTSPVQVQLSTMSNSDDPKTSNRLQVAWQIPLSVEFAAQPVLPVPTADEAEIPEELAPACRYKWQPRRKVATIRYGGFPQDEGIAAVRKKLYEQVTRDGLKPRMENGRPVFFFWSNTVKACYLEEGGLGMAVYDWRPDFIKPNQVGIELET